MAWHLNCTLTPISHVTSSGIRVFEQGLQPEIVNEDESKAVLALIPVYSVWMNALIVRFFLRKEDADSFAKELEAHLSAVNTDTVKRVTAMDPHPQVDGLHAEGWHAVSIQVQDLELSPAGNEAKSLPGFVAHLDAGVSMGGDDTGPFHTAAEAVDGARRFQERMSKLVPNENFVAATQDKPSSSGAAP